MPKPLDLATFMAAHQAGVWRLVRVLGADTALADDITQEVFLAAYRVNFEERSAPETAKWLRLTARNLFLKHVKKKRPVNVAELHALERAWEEQADDSGEELVRALRDCLGRLDTAPREALERLYREQGPREQVARDLGFTLDGLKTLVRRAKERLRACIERRTKDSRA